MLISQGELGMPGMPGKQGVKVVHFYCSIYPSPFIIMNYPFFPEPCMLFQKHSTAETLSLICYDCM